MDANNMHIMLQGQMNGVEPMRIQYVKQLLTVEGIDPSTRRGGGADDLIFEQGDLHMHEHLLKMLYAITGSVGNKLIQHIGH